MDLVENPGTRTITIAGNTISLANIITYASTTISIFVTKKAIYKHKGTYADVAGFDSIKCVMIRAKMKLCLVRDGQPFAGWNTQSIAKMKQQPHIQKLRLSKRSQLTIDATNTFLPVIFRPLHDQDLGQPLSWWYLIPLYATGVIGFLGPASQFPLRVLPPTEGTMWLREPSLPFVASLVFCGVVAMHFQRDLVVAVVVSFDFVYASAQVILAALCVSDLASWNLSVSLTMFLWMVWFLWMFLLDALSPVMRQRLRFHKRMILPMQLVLLLITVWISTEIFLGTPFTNGNRLFIEYHVSANQKFRLTTIGILVERLVTILGWFGPRIVADMLFAEKDELLFLRGMVEYMSSYDTFPPRATRVQPSPPPSELLQTNAME